MASWGSCMLHDQSDLDRCRSVSFRVSEASDFRAFIKVRNRFNISDGHRVHASFGSCIVGSVSMPLGAFQSFRVRSFQSLLQCPQPVPKAPMLYKLLASWGNCSPDDQSDLVLCCSVSFRHLGSWVLGLLTGLATGTSTSSNGYTVLPSFGSCLLDDQMNLVRCRSVSFKLLGSCNIRAIL
jgi:hypothetical protein